MLGGLVLIDRSLLDYLFLMPIAFWSTGIWAQTFPRPKGVRWNVWTINSRDSWPCTKVLVGGSVLAL